LIYIVVSLLVGLERLSKACIMRGMYFSVLSDNVGKPRFRHQRMMIPHSQRE